MGPVPSSPSNQPKTRDQNKPQPWKMSCLRPAPPSRGYLNQNEAGSKRNSISSKTNLLKKGKLYDILTRKITKFATMLFLFDE